MPEPSSPDSFPGKALWARGKRRPPSAIRAVLQAYRLLGLAFGVEIAERRNSDDPLQRVLAEARLKKLLLGAYQEACAILGEHLDKIHQSRRSH